MIASCHGAPRALIMLTQVTTVLMLAACGGGGEGARANDARAERATAPAAAAASRPRIVVLGDSLTAGLGLDPADAYPALLQQFVDRAGLPYEVVNAGVSGDTSAGGLRRLDWALEGDVRILIVALGANDGLRGLAPAELEANLSAIIKTGQARGATVILAGMEAPPNFGQAYTAEFRQVYPRVARRHDAVLLPFLLDGVAGVSDMNQRDGIHPTAAGARRVAENVWDVLEPAAHARAVSPPTDRPPAS
jgi:acyl-CoA thioesterase-1